MLFMTFMVIKAGWNHTPRTLSAWKRLRQRLR